MDSTVATTNPSSVCQEQDTARDNDFQRACKQRLFLAQIVEANLKKYRRKHKAAYRWAFITRFATVMVSAVVTALLAVDLDPSPAIRNVALMGAGFTGVVSGLAAFFDFNSLSVSYKVTAERLETLLAQIEYLATGDRIYTIEEVADLRDQYLTILEKAAAAFLKAKQDEMGGNR